MMIRIMIVPIHQCYFRKIISAKTEAIFWRKKIRHTNYVKRGSLHKASRKPLF